VQGPSGASAGGLSSTAGRGTIVNKLIKDAIIPKIGKGIEGETVTSKHIPPQTPTSSKAESFVDARPAATASKIGTGIGKGSASAKP
jgi:hypothetical protein